MWVILHQAVSHFTNSFLKLLNKEIKSSDERVFILFEIVVLLKVSQFFAPMSAWNFLK